MEICICICICLWIWIYVCICRVLDGLAASWLVVAAAEVAMLVAMVSFHHSMLSMVE